MSGGVAGPVKRRGGGRLRTWAVAAALLVGAPGGDARGAPTASGGAPTASGGVPAGVQAVTAFAGPELAERLLAGERARSAGEALLPDTIPSRDELRQLLGAEGDRAAGMVALGAFARSLPPARGTLWIQLLAAVERTDAALAPDLLDAVVRAEDGQGRDAARTLEERAADARDGDRSALLWMAALTVQRAAPDEAARLRARLLVEHPEAMEAPEAALRQARWLLTSGGDRETALALLEELIVERPDHPVVPEARALLMGWRSP